MKPILQHVGNGYTRLPNGSTVLATYAASLGYTVTGLPPKSAVEVSTAVRRAVTVGSDPAPALPPATPSAAQAALDERWGAVLSLPEATGRFAAARMVAASTMPLAEAGRFLASLPEDEPPAPPAVLPPADPKAARLAEIRTMKLPRRGDRA